MTGILQGFALLCKLAVLLLKPLWDYQIKILRKNVKDSGRSGKTTPSCKWPIEIYEKDYDRSVTDTGGFEEKIPVLLGIKSQPRHYDPWLLVQVLYHLATVGQGH